MFNIQKFISRNINFGLATDTGGGTSFSMFKTMAAAYYVAQLNKISLHPAQLFWMATVGSAKSLKLNNEIGNILDIKSVSDLCQKYNSLFHTDAVQAVGHYKIDLKSIKIDFLSSAGHKFHGPKGVGFTYINKLTKIKLKGWKDNVERHPKKKGNAYKVK